eukprot:gene10657-13054_t
MVLPPPNVTGSLHIGHSLTTTIEDSIIRYQRMNDKDTVWIPGLDHSGIATQVVVEKHLSKKGISRYDLGREKFVEEVFKWTDIYSQNINNQLRITGSSLDWNRSVFTLDKKRSEAVEEAFIRMFNMGLIYRSTRLVNWCPNLQSVISDIEVDHQSFAKPTNLKLKTRKRSIEVGVIHNIAYKMEDESLPDLIISTTRPETIFGDTALAIHPEDTRYSGYHGKFAVHPFDKSRRLPIVLDSILVDQQLGTGVVKITPAHDFNDYQCGQRHQLESINILNGNGTLNENTTPQFKGMDRLEARPIVIEELKKMGLYLEKKPHPTTLAFCSRSGDLLEPILQPQWYVKSKEMADRALEYVEKGELIISPDFYRDHWSRWLSNIQDWCISRQLWWGNPIPAYKIITNNTESEDEKWVVGKSKEEARLKTMELYGLKEDEFQLEQDQDVLDTWFSSGLFPISSLGWPHETNSPDFKKYYPLDIMETGSDILFFWVARMVMMCSTLTGVVPFKKILLHPLVRDSQGRKMSKSLGNVIDPLHIINGVSLDQLKENLENSNLSDQEKKAASKTLEKEYPKGIPQCGTDALRISLAQFPINGKDINLDVSKIVGNRLFCNKIWNASKLVLSFNENTEIQNLIYNGNQQPFDNSLISLIDKWILFKLSNLVETVIDSFENNNLSVASQSLYMFFQYEFCDIYLECIKADLSMTERKITNQHSPLVMINVLETFLRLLHPFMPYITEDLWQRIPKPNNSPNSIMISTYPSLKYHYHQDYKNLDQVEDQVAVFLEALHLLRSQRKNNQIQYQTKLFVTINSPDQSIIDTFTQLQNSLEKIVNCKLTFSTNIDNNNNSNNRFKIKDTLMIDIDYEKPLESKQDNDQKIMALESKKSKVLAGIKEMEDVTLKN